MEIKLGETLGLGEALSIVYQYYRISPSSKSYIMTCSITSAIAGVDGACLQGPFKLQFRGLLARVKLLSMKHVLPASLVALP